MTNTELLNKGNHENSLLMDHSLIPQEKREHPLTTAITSCSAEARVILPSFGMDWTKIMQVEAWQCCIFFFNSRVKDLTAHWEKKTLTLEQYSQYFNWWQQRFFLHNVVHASNASVIFIIQMTIRVLGSRKKVSQSEFNSYQYWTHPYQTYQIFH